MEKNLQGWYLGTFKHNIYEYERIYVCYLLYIKIKNLKINLKRYVFKNTYVGT